MQLREVGVFDLGDDEMCLRIFQVNSLQHGDDEMVEEESFGDSVCVYSNHQFHSYFFPLVPSMRMYSLYMLSCNFPGGVM